MDPYSGDVYELRETLVPEAVGEPFQMEALRDAVAGLEDATRDEQEAALRAQLVRVEEEAARRLRLGWREQERRRRRKRR